MKNKIFVLTAFLAILLFAGCEKVIDLKLDDADPVLVIDAGISDQNENLTVRVSKTYNFTDPNRFNGVAGAQVVLTTGAGTKINYAETAVAGVYQGPKFKGRPGTSYTLDVMLDGKTYSAVSTMPEKVVLDSLTFKEFSFFGEANTYVAANYNDPAGVQNQYRYILKVKGKVEEDAVSEDRFDDGNAVSNVIFYELEDLVKGDTIDVEFQCIERNVYRYFYSLDQNSGGGGPPVAPANPPSNFNNGALGVFNAYTSSTKSIVLK